MFQSCLSLQQQCWIYDVVDQELVTVYNYLEQTSSMFECAAAFLAVWNVCDEFWEVNAAV